MHLTSIKLDQVRAEYSAKATNKGFRDGEISPISHKA